jgi:class 3 adenylate cyclase
MFTDVVSFSKLSSINEERTYAALKRDFELLYQHIGAYGGQVLNTMGDGMMVVFMSAVDAARCARAIQEALYQQALAKPEHGVLQHRIGLHAGDIILNGRNTMGDTVNQAARIQSLARPDSVAMSREFHEFIKNKVDFDIKYLGPRMTKNIPAPIPIHEISPIDDAIKQHAADILFTPPPSEANKEVSGRKGIALLVISLILLGAAAAPIFLLGSMRKSVNDQAARDGRNVKPGSIRNSPEKLQQIKDAIGKGKQGEATNGPADTNTPDANTPATNTPVTAPVAFALTPDQLKQIDEMTQRHDYVGILGLVRGIPGVDSPDGQAMLSKYDGLSKFKDWLQQEVGAATAQSPIVASIEGYSSKIFSSAGGVVIQANEQTSTPKNLWEWKSSTLLSIAEAVVAVPPTRSPAPAEATTWISTYRELHRL